MIRNLTRDTVLARQALWARTPLLRLRGMLGRRFDGFDAMIFPRNNSIHMCFMAIPLDVLFVDGQGEVRGLRHSLRPWRLAWQPDACTTIELPAGALLASGTQLGDRLEF